MIKAAIVGLGWWGKTLAESGQGSDAIRFVAGASRTVTPELEAFAKKNGFRLLPNYEAVLADPSVDAVVLATPHSMHGAQVVAAAKAGKHVFCEKPFTLTKRQAEDAVAAVRKAGVTVRVAPATKRMASLFSEASTSVLPHQPSPTMAALIICKTPFEPL